MLVCLLGTMTAWSILCLPHLNAFVCHSYCMYLAMLSSYIVVSIIDIGLAAGKNVHCFPHLHSLQTACRLDPSERMRLLLLLGEGRGCSLWGHDFKMPLPDVILAGGKNVHCFPHLHSLRTACGLDPFERMRLLLFEKKGATLLENVLWRFGFDPPLLHASPLMPKLLIVNGNADSGDDVMP